MDNDLIDMIAAGEKSSATDIHDKIKDLLYAKSAENIDLVKPAVTADMFGGPNPYLNDEEEVLSLGVLKLNRREGFASKLFYEF